MTAHDSLIYRPCAVMDRAYSGSKPKFKLVGN